MQRKKETVELKDGFDIRNLLSREGVDFTIKLPDKDYSLENDLDITLNGDNKNFYEFIDPDGEALELVTFSEVRDKMENLTDDGKLKKFVVRKGNGLCPGDVPVFLHYISYIEDDITPFDSSYNRTLRPEMFKLGIGEVYNGFEMAVKTMKQDEVSCFLIHPDLAFKELGIPPRIPPNAWIFLQVYLVKIGNPREECKEEGDDGYIDKRSFQEIYKKVKVQLVLGNNNFRNEIIQTAIKNYRKAENILHTCRLKSDEEEKKWKKMLLKIYLNLSVCFNHNSVKKPKLACLMITEAFEILPELAFHHPKLIFQLGKAKYALDDFKGAEKYFKRALRMREDDEEIITHLNMAQSRIQEEKLCQNMDSLMSFRGPSLDAKE